MQDMIPVQTRPLVESAVADGRTVTVTTYRDRGTPVTAVLLFETPGDAQAFAQFVSCARVVVTVPP